ncbi:hypothetical protein HDU93_005514 [Gonapodya sp. JEL0774]|nr:hypothetical protein HDU93_005514 [Gonapodya sp. JEL0774]
MLSEHSANSVDLVVVGGGLAGLVAVIEAHATIVAAGKEPKIVLLEREGKLGGNSAKASSGMNGLTHYQSEQGIVDSTATFVEDTVNSGGGKSRKELVKVLVEESGEAVEWVERHANLTLPAISWGGGHSVARTHREPQADKPRPIGFSTIRGLQSRVSTLPGVQILTSTRAISLLRSGTVVTGVRYVTFPESTPPTVRNADLSSLASDVELTTQDLPARAVVLATGGYSSDWGSSSLLRKWASATVEESLGTTSGDWATGDGVKMVEKFGGKLVDMESVQIHGAILLTSRGTRFANELSLRSHLSAAIVRQAATYGTRHGQSVAWMVLTERGAKLYDEAAVQFYTKKGFFKRVGNAKTLAKHMGVETSVLEETFAEYNNAAEGREHDTFGKTHFATTFLPTEPLYVAEITPAIHYTMGGALIDTSGRVVDATAGDAIGGLWAAGEVTGGVHGANRLVGNSLLECVVFGRRAGRGAAEKALKVRGDGETVLL